MKFGKTIIAGAIAMSMASFGAAAAPGAPGALAPAKDMGQGVINFKGTVIDAPCGIAPESADQSIDFGQISKSHLNLGGTSVKKDLDIKLVNCEIGGQNNTVSVKFSGGHITAHPTELGTAGDTNTAIVVYDANDKQVNFDGTESNGSIHLKNGSNTLHYTAYVKKAAGAGDIKEGSFSAVTNFSLTYQ
ncbi:fimbrial protein [Escherichia coli]|uniref:fimbrial protein n=1 Tax=Escherichia coli TaxID=562 RepID=UPI0011360B43|nr:fimbrial protein [Escherichia coli]TJF18466.1 type 1 fimbrial protein [Escherichia coli]